MWVMHLSMFSPRGGSGGGGGDYPWELDDFEKFGFNFLPMWHDFVSKIPWDVPSILDIISSRFSSWDIYGHAPVPKLSVNSWG